jgi:hypothetical protein
MAAVKAELERALRAINPHMKRTEGGYVEQKNEGID